jgi:uncharacterized protein YdaU (DUF1376 family)
MRLIMHCWQHGCIPLDDRKLALISHCDSRLWHQYKKTVMQFFDAVDASTAQHKRVSTELRRCAELSSKRKAAALQKHSNSSAIALQLHTQSQSPLQKEEEKKDYCRFADAEPTTLETKKQKPKRKLSDPEFEEFWVSYPKTPNMSKKEAWDVWKRLTPEDRALAIRAVPRYRAWLKGKADKAPETVHACRFLSKRRFDGFAQTTFGDAPEGFYAAFGSQEQDAWDAYGRTHKGTSYPRDKRGGWTFPTRWPPGHENGGEPECIGNIVQFAIAQTS